MRALAIVLGIGPPMAAHAAAAEIHIDVTGAPAAAVKAIAADVTARDHAHFAFTVAQPATLERELVDGAAADLVILPAPLVAKLVKAGVLRGTPSVPLARVGIGVVVPAGAPRPDIATPAAIRRLLVNARAIVYPDPQSGGGSAGRAIMQMIDAMGLTDLVKPKLTHQSAIGGGVALVASGKADVGFFNISEILPIKGVTLVGPLPQALQSYIVFTAAIPAKAAAPDAALAFLRELGAPAARAAWRKAGLEPLQ